MRFRPAGVAAAITAALAVSLLPSAAADDVRDRKERVEASIDALKGDLAETSEKLAAAVVKLREAEAKLPAARKAVAKTQTELKAARDRDAQLKVRLDAARKEVEKAERELQAVLAEIEASQKLVGGIARETYQNGTMGELSVMLEAESPEDFANRLAIVHSTMESENAALDRLAKAQAQLVVKRKELEAKQAEIEKLKAEAAQQVKTTAAAATAAKDASAKVERLVQQARAAKAGVEAEKAAELRRIAAMESQAAQLESTLAERARKAKAAADARAAAEVAESRAGNAGRASRSSSRAPIGGGGFIDPVDGSLTSSFGMRQHPITGVYKLHDGTDYGAGCGTPIRAAQSGTVIWASDKGGYGNQLAIDHGMVNGVNLVTSYSHQSRFAVGSGTQVSRGQVIGYVGTTGYSTGCHLHFMAYENGNPVNAASYL